MWSPCQDMVILGYHLLLDSGIIDIPDVLSKLRSTIVDIDSSIHI